MNDDYTRATLEANLTIYNEKKTSAPNEDGVEVGAYGWEEQDIKLSRPLTDVEEIVWALEAKKSDIGHDLWRAVESEEVFEDWIPNLNHSPYVTPTDITVKCGYWSDLFHEVVAHIAERDDDEAAGVYMDLAANPRLGRGDGLHSNRGVRGLLEYLADVYHIDTSRWTFGERVRKD